jgi:hypothetical protein
VRRINTYGNSFTQCHQVSDGETWQEYLAAPLGEPIRNFGVGGHGVFQAYRSTLHLLEQFKSFAEANGKNLLVLLTHGAGKVASFVSGELKNEHDRSVIDGLQRHNIPYVDSLNKYQGDFEQFSITPREYVDRYYIGHYNPMGNHFLAYAVKDAVVDWLNPRPITYRDKTSIMDFNDGQ